MNIKLVLVPSKQISTKEEDKELLLNYLLYLSEIQ